MAKFSGMEGDLCARAAAAAVERKFNFIKICVQGGALFFALVKKIICHANHIFTFNSSECMPPAVQLRREKKKRNEKI